MKSFAILTLAAAAAAFHGEPQPAGLIPRQAIDTTTRNILVGSKGRIEGFTFNGTDFVPNSKVNFNDTGAVPSWMTFKDPNFLYAVDEDTANIRLFNYDPKAGSLTGPVSTFNHSAGIVHLAFTHDKSKLIGSSYTDGAVDIWDAAADGSLKLNTTITLTGTPGPTGKHRAHQAVLDPTGKYFVINDLGGDSLHILDTQTWNVTGVVPVTPANSGPRHGAFVSLNGTQASHYIVACETANTLQMFTVSYNPFALTGYQTISIFHKGDMPANISSTTAGELSINTKGPAYVYVSSRNSGNQTDFITRFGIEKKNANDTSPWLAWKGRASSGGAIPRHFSFSKDEKYLFSANMNGQIALQANERCVNGELCQIGNATAKYQMEDFLGADVAAKMSGQFLGPAFVMEF